MMTRGQKVLIKEEENGEQNDQGQTEKENDEREKNREGKYSLFPSLL